MGTHPTNTVTANVKLRYLWQEVANYGAIRALAMRLVVNLMRWANQRNKQIIKIGFSYVNHWYFLIGTFISLLRLSTILIFITPIRVEMKITL